MTLQSAAHYAAIRPRSVNNQTSGLQLADIPPPQQPHASILYSSPI